MNVEGQPLPVTAVSRPPCGIIFNPKAYRDATKMCYEVVHRDVDGVVSPSGVAIFHGRPILQNGDETWLTAPGDYDFITRQSGTGFNFGIHHTFVSVVRTHGRWTIGVASLTQYPNRPDQHTTQNYIGGSVRTLYEASPGRWKLCTIERPSFFIGKSEWPIAVSLLRLGLSSYVWSDKKTGGSWSSAGEWRVPRFAPDIGKIDTVARFFRDLVPSFGLMPDEERDLYAQCLDGQDCFTSNGLAYAQDLAKVGDSIRALMALAGNPTSPKQWASTWLSLRFGDRLQVKDSIELLHAVRSELKHLYGLKLSYKETHARLVRSVPVSTQLIESGMLTANARLQCDNNSNSHLMSSVKKLMEWDVWPSLENTWDMIPLSFVVDWCLNLSTILANIDRMVYEQYLRVRVYERSNKVTVKFTQTSVEHAFGTGPDVLNAQLTGKYYHRWSAPRPQLGILDGWSPSLPAPQNYVDAAALLVQMR